MAGIHGSVAILPLGEDAVAADAGRMELLILLAVIVLVDVAALVGWAPDRRSGRDWQPRGGWQPTEDLRRPPLSGLGTRH